MSGFKLYRSTDPNAPLFTRGRTSLISLLRSCLIDGYGDKTSPGGWTLEFINATEDIAVFRNDPLNGTGSYLRVDCKTPLSDYEVYLNGYEAMTDIDSGSGPFQPSQRIGRSALSTTPVGWWLNASPTTLNLFFLEDTDSGVILNNTDVQVYSRMIHFGDFYSYANLAWPALVGTSSAYSATKDGVFDTVSADTISVPRDILSTPNTPRLINAHHLGPVDIYFNGPTYNGKLLLAKIGLSDGLYMNDFYGIMQGLAVPCHPAATFELGFNTEYPGNSGEKYINLVFQCYNGSISFFKQIMLRDDQVI